MVLIYKFWCHVCGRKFTYKSQYFINTPSIIVNGEERKVCSCCLINPTAHSEDEIVDSHLNGYWALKPNRRYKNEKKKNNIDNAKAKHNGTNDIPKKFSKNF